MAEAAPRRRRIAILAAIALALAATICALLLATTRPPYEFIAKLHGESIAPPPRPIDPRLSGTRYPLHSGAPAKEHYYAFDVPEKVLKDAIFTELGRKGTVMSNTSKRSRYFMVSPKPLNVKGRTLGFSILILDSMEMSPYQLNGRERWVVSFRTEPTWLDERWQQIKGWFGRGTPGP